MSRTHSTDAAHLHQLLRPEDLDARLSTHGELADRDAAIRVVWSSNVRRNGARFTVRPRPQAAGEAVRRPRVVRGSGCGGSAATTTTATSTTAAKTTKTATTTDDNSSNISNDIIRCSSGAPRDQCCRTAADDATTRWCHAQAFVLCNCRCMGQRDRKHSCEQKWLAGSCSSTHFGHCMLAGPPQPTHRCVSTPPAGASSAVGWSPMPRAGGTQAAAGTRTRAFGRSGGGAGEGRNVSGGALAPPPRIAPARREAYRRCSCGGSGGRRTATVATAVHHCADATAMAASRCRRQKRSSRHREATVAWRITSSGRTSAITDRDRHRRCRRRWRYC